MADEEKTEQEQPTAEETPEEQPVAAAADEVVVEGAAVVTDEDLEEDVEEERTPRVKPEIPGADLEVDIVRAGEDRPSHYSEDDEDGEGSDDTESEDLT